MEEEGKGGYEMCGKEGHGIFFSSSSFLVLVKA